MTPSELSALLLTEQAPRKWFPKGRQVGSEWVVGSIKGEPGDGLRINLETGTWLCFTTSDAGPDPVSLYAAMHNIPQLEAVHRLAKTAGNGAARQPVQPVTPRSEPEPKPAPPEPAPPQAASQPAQCRKCDKPLIKKDFAPYCSGTCMYNAQQVEAGKPEFNPPVAVARSRDDLPRIYVPPAPTAHKGRPTGRPALAVIEGGKARQPVSRMMQWQELGLYLGDKGAPAMNIDNMERLIDNHPELAGKFWYDSFYRRLYTSWNGPTREYSDADNLHLTVHLQRDCELARLTDELTYKGVISYGYRNARDSARDWMESLVWDNVPRVDGFLHTHMGANDSKYTLDVSRNFWLSMVARIYYPGCKFDNMVILEGLQGTYKSTALQVIAGDWYKVPTAEIGSKDFLLGLGGVMLMEFGELTDFRKVDANVIKRVLSTPVDYYRPPYGRADKKHPRQCIFVGTTNESHYLQDSTGNRRFWPIQCSTINLEQIRAEREQLFAEAVARYKASQANWYTEPHDSTVQQRERMQIDSWDDAIARYINGRTEVTISEIAQQCLEIRIERHDTVAQRRIGRCLRLAGWNSLQVRRDGTRMWVWRSPNYQAPLSSTVSPTGENDEF